MAFDNTVTVVGNITRDPELRFTASGVAMANISVADSRRYQDRNGDWQEDTSFFTGTVWREQAEQIAESLQKGARVIVTGRLEQRSWETQEGDKRSVVEIQIDEMGHVRDHLACDGLLVPRRPVLEGAGNGADAACLYGHLDSRIGR